MFKKVLSKTFPTWRTGRVLVKQGLVSAMMRGTWIHHWSVGSCLDWTFHHPCGGDSIGFWPPKMHCLSVDVSSCLPLIMEPQFVLAHLKGRVLEECVVQTLRQSSLQCLQHHDRQDVSLQKTSPQITLWQTYKKLLKIAIYSWFAH